MLLAEAPPALLVPILVIAAPLGFVAIWSGVCLLLGLVSGWGGLARRFRTREEAPAGAEGGLFARIGLIAYRGVLGVGRADDGLDLRVMLLFRPGHPPLRIPWSEIRVEGERSLFGFGKVTRLRLGAGGPLLNLPSATWERVRPRG